MLIIGELLKQADLYISEVSLVPTFHSFTTLQQGCTHFKDGCIIAVSSVIQYGCMCTVCLCGWVDEHVCGCAYFVPLCAGVWVCGCVCYVAVVLFICVLCI